MNSEAVVGDHQATPTAKSAGGENAAINVPDMSIAWSRFWLCSQHKSPAEKGAIREELMQKIMDTDALYIYKIVMEDAGELPDAALENTLKSRNAAKLADLEAKLLETKEKYGESEIKEALQQKAVYLAQIGDKEGAIMAYSLVLPLAVSSGAKLDIYLALIRLGLFWKDSALIKKYMELAFRALEKGGDWERQNKLKIYQGLYCILARDFKKAADLFLNTMATFSAQELLSFEQFVFYTSIVGLLTLDRPTLAKRVLESPEGNEVYASNAKLSRLVNSYYLADYRTFVKSLIDTCETMADDLFFHLHRKYFLRQMRLRAYSQFLEPYKSVTLANMSHQFGMHPDFLEQDLVSFISTRSLNCKVDKVSCCVQPVQVDPCVAQQALLLRESDELLDKMSRLVKLVDI